MSPEFTPFVEKNNSFFFAWFGGYINLLGSIDHGRRVSKRHDREYLNFYPSIRVRSRDRASLDSLADVFGGKVAMDGTRWVLQGEELYYLLSRSIAYMPSRREVAGQVLSILASMKKSSGMGVGDVKSVESHNFEGIRKHYEVLVNNPAVVAGVFDAIVKLSKDNRGNYPTIRARATSGDEDLLSVLCSKFGGSVLRQKHGKVNFINGRKVESKRDSFVWHIFEGDTLKLLRFAGRHIFLSRDKVKQRLEEVGVDGSCFL